MTACKTAELATGWVTNPAPWPPANRDRWSFFTGQDKANMRFSNGTLVNGPLGIIGAIDWRCDPNNDGWADAKEIFNLANVTTLSYSMAEAKQQTPQHYYGAMNGKIPIVQYNNNTDGQIEVSTLGDINADKIVNISDAALIGVNWQKTAPPTNPSVDLNNDGIVNISDAAVVSMHWMNTYT